MELLRGERMKTIKTEWGHSKHRFLQLIDAPKCLKLPQNRWFEIQTDGETYWIDGVKM